MAQYNFTFNNHLSVSTAAVDTEASGQELLAHLFCGYSPRYYGSTTQNLPVVIYRLFGNAHSKQIF